MDDVNSKDMSRYIVIENGEGKLATKRLFSWKLKLEDLLCRQSELPDRQRIILQILMPRVEFYDEVIWCLAV